GPQIVSFATLRNLLDNLVKMASGQLVVVWNKGQALLELAICGRGAHQAMNEFPPQNWRHTLHDIVCRDRRKLGHKNRKQSEHILNQRRKVREVDRTFSRFVL